MMWKAELRRVIKLLWRTEMMTDVGTVGGTVMMVTYVVMMSVVDEWTIAKTMVS